MKRVTKIIIGIAIIASTAGGIAYAKGSLSPEQRAQLHEKITDRMDFMHERMSRIGRGGDYAE